mmetsp:Transcript_60056/g.137679  ORF Transcript_60056/g.137679 Transcript_60056/m.137679 type:complete len:308 (+) Transcript_60056:261-1184(+)
METPTSLHSYTLVVPSPDLRHSVLTAVSGVSTPSAFLDFTNANDSAFPAHGDVSHRVQLWSTELQYTVCAQRGCSAIGSAAEFDERSQHISASARGLRCMLTLLRKGREVDHAVRSPRHDAVVTVPSDAERLGRMRRKVVQRDRRARVPQPHRPVVARREKQQRLVRSPSHPAHPRLVRKAQPCGETALPDVPYAHAMVGVACGDAGRGERDVHAQDRSLRRDGGGGALGRHVPLAHGAVPRRAIEQSSCAPAEPRDAIGVCLHLREALHLRHQRRPSALLRGTLAVRIGARHGGSAPDQQLPVPTA